MCVATVKNLKVVFGQHNACDVRCGDCLYYSFLRNMPSSFSHSPDYYKEFSGQQAKEKLEFVTPLHWVSMLPSLVGISMLIVLVPVVYVLLFSFEYDIAQSVGFFALVSVLWLGCIHFFFIRLLNYFFRVIIVSNFRVLDIHRTTVLKRQRRTLDFATIQDIQFSQKGLIQRIFDYGTISIQNATGENVFHFHYIPTPEKYYNILNHIYRKAVGTHGSRIHHLISNNEHTGK